MLSKLEKELNKLLGSTVIADDRELEAAVNSVIDREIAKPLEEQDTELIEEAVELLLDINNIDEAFINDKVREKVQIAQITDKNTLEEIEPDKDNDKRKHSSHITFKILIPIAIILSILMASVVFSSSMEYDMITTTKKGINNILKCVFFRLDDNTSIIKTDNIREYSSFEEMCESESLELYYWKTLPDGCVKEDIRVEDYGTYRDISVTLTDDNSISYIIKAPSPDKIDFGDEKPIHINDLDIYLTCYDDVYYASWTHSGSVYILYTSSDSQRSEMINNLIIKGERQ